MTRSERVRWHRWTRLPISGSVVALAVITLALDITTAWARIPLVTLGRIPVSPALPLGVVLAVMVGLRRLGLDPTNRRAWREFLAVAAWGLLAAMLGYAMRIGGGKEATGLVLAAVGEELVYRLAAVIVIGALTARLLGRPWRNAEDWGVAPGVIAITAGAVLFATLPGHVLQMRGVLTVLPFVSLGMVLGYALLRTGALVPAAFVHAVLNMATIGVLVGAVSLGMRSLFAAAALAALVAGTAVAGRRLGILGPAPATSSA